MSCRPVRLIRSLAATSWSALLVEWKTSSAENANETGRTVFGSDRRGSDVGIGVADPAGDDGNGDRAFSRDDDRGPGDRSGAERREFAVAGRDGRDGAARKPGNPHPL